MLAALAAIIAISSAQPTPTIGDLKACLATAVGRLDDGVSDASTIAGGALESCDDMVETVVAEIASQDRELNSAQGHAQLRQDLESKLTKIALQAVLEERAARRSSP